MIKVKEGETGIGGPTKTTEGEYYNNSCVRQQRPQTGLWLRDSNVMGNPRFFKGMVSTAATLVQGHQHLLLGSLQPPSNLSCSGPVSFSLISAQLLLCAYCAIAPTSLRAQVSSSLGSVRAALLGSHYLWLHPVRCAYLFSPLHKAAILAVPQTHQICSCLRDLPGPGPLLNIPRANSSTSCRSLLKCPLISDIVLDNSPPSLPWYFLSPLPWLAFPYLITV